jgi:hypothetical protein
MMNRTKNNARRTLQQEGVSHSPSDLAERFREWQRLREEVRDLEQSVSSKHSNLDDKGRWK